MNWGKNNPTLMWLQIASTTQFILNAGTTRFWSLAPKPGPDYCLNSCLYNSTQFWRDTRAHTKELAFTRLLGYECHADWTNSGHKSQTSTMTLFIRTWPPECRSTLWAINFHRPRTWASAQLILRRKTHPGKAAGLQRAPVSPLHICLSFI